MSMITLINFIGRLKGKIQENIFHVLIKIITVTICHNMFMPIFYGVKGLKMIMVVFIMFK